MPFIGNLVYALHISREDAWNYSFPEYFAVIKAANPEEEKKTVEFSDDELEQLEKLKKLV